MTDSIVCSLEETMRRLALIGLAFGLALPAAHAMEAGTFEGHEIVVVSVARAKEFRDLKVKDAKKRDLAIVTIEVRWRGEKRHVLIRDNELAVRDARGENHECALRFVQADAVEEQGPARLEIPFQVRADVALQSLRVGKSLLAIDSPASAPQP
jgi:hypothetical protein